MRTIAIPRHPVPERMRRARAADALPCVICGLPVTRPRFLCHMIDGGGVALHPADESLYTPDGGDMGEYPVGADCLRRFPEMRPYSFAAPPPRGGRLPR